MLACSSPADCAEIERRSRPASACSPTAARAAATCSRATPTRRSSRSAASRPRSSANPGYRAFLANGFNVTRALVLFFFEIALELTAALRAARRDVRPRGHRGGIYPLDARGDVRVRPRPDRLRRADRHDARPAGRLRDVLELRRGRPPLRARCAPTRWRRCASSTSSSRGIANARGATPRGPTRSSSSPTTGRRRARRSSSATATGSTSWSTGRSAARRGRRSPAATSRTRWSRDAVDEATGPRRGRSAAEADVSDRDVVVLGSGNLGLVYLMEEKRRLTLEEIEERHPSCCPPCASTRTSAGCSSAPRSTAPSCSARGGARYLDEDRVEGEDPLAPVLAHRGAAPACAPTASPTSPTSWSAASTTPTLDEGCAFEELISFHGGLGGPQTAAVHPRPAERRAADGAADRRRRGARPAARLAAGASGARGRPAPGAGCGAGARGRSSRAGST